MAGVDRDGARRPALPGELREPLAGAPPTADAFDAEEFVRRTAARAGSSPGQAGQYARAVPATLEEKEVPP